MTDSSAGGFRDGEPVERDSDESESRRPLPADLARRFFDACPVSAVLIDATGEIVHATDRAAETLGLAHEDLVGRPYDPSEWGLYYDDGTPVPVDDHPVTRVFETGEPVVGFEHWIERTDGGERWFSSNAAPLFDEDGTVEYVAIAFEDVTALKRGEKRLTSDHVRLLEFRADESAVPPSLRVEDEPTWIDIDSVVSLPDGTTVQYMGTADLTASDFVTATEEVPHYLDARLLSSVDGYNRIEAHSESETVAHVFSALGGRPREIVIASDEVRFRGELPGDVDHRQAGDEIRRFHPDAELVAETLVYSPQLLSDIVADALTDRQLAALDAAYFSGYFATPRTSTGDELADRFGVTRQTFNQHLRKAEQTVFQHLFEKSGAEGH
ncbi:bacterio-opsin activator domain-containing protein [Natrinema longum]|uniref:Helix-turn-helix domain-containing protein n=1 Tax=Natrinema longum TaxID=370324 RepID=A0A8A2U4J3_9EURY|nr:bacterio-opsin activator domain-containing protein [Natrinema longum]MBZ6494907.1 helix-turn-helix domain-containing protein [Natrinema longum]QSW83794.1 helix-turn-helix domain-containing protein [Natrinema longum]